MSCRQAADRFGVSAASAIRWRSRHNHKEWLISYLGELYKAGSDPAATGKTVIKEAIKEGAVGILDYHKQMKEIEKADLGNTWLMGSLYSCSFILEAMAQGQEVSPSDIR